MPIDCAWSCPVQAGRCGGEGSVSSALQRRVPSLVPGAHSVLPSLCAAPARAAPIFRGLVEPLPTLIFLRLPPSIAVLSLPVVNWSSWGLLKGLGGISRGGSIRGRLNDSLGMLWNGQEPMRAIERMSADEKNKALIKAAKHSDVVPIKLLLNAAADVAAVDKFEKTALMQAVIYGQKEVVSELLSARADVNAVDKNKCTPLHFSAEHGCCQIASTLLIGGANPNAVDEV